MENILAMYWGFRHFANYLGQGLCLRSKVVFPGLALATLTSPGLHTGCKGMDSLSLRKAMMNHKENSCQCPTYDMKDPEYNLWPFGGQLNPAHLKDGTSAVRSPMGKEELLQGF